MKSTDLNKEYHYLNILNVFFAANNIFLKNCWTPNIQLSLCRSGVFLKNIIGYKHCSQNSPASSIGRLKITPHDIEHNTLF